MCIEILFKQFIEISNFSMVTTIDYGLVSSYTLSSYLLTDFCTTMYTIFGLSGVIEIISGDFIFRRVITVFLVETVEVAVRAII